MLNARCPFGLNACGLQGYREFLAVETLQIVVQVDSDYRSCL